MEVKPGVNLPAKFLCRKCRFCLGGDEKGVNCEAAQTTVEPVLRRDVPRYERCPRRSRRSGLVVNKFGLGSGYVIEMTAETLTQEGLIELAAQARQKGTSDPAKLSSVEEALRRKSGTSERD